LLFGIRPAPVTLFPTCGSTSWSPPSSQHPHKHTFTKSYTQTLIHSCAGSGHRGQREVDCPADQDPNPDKLTTQAGLDCGERVVWFCFLNQLFWEFGGRIRGESCYFEKQELRFWFKDVQGVTYS